MSDFGEVLEIARRVADMIERGLSDARDSFASEDSYLEARRALEHHATGLYLSGAFAYLEEQYGAMPWRSPDFDRALSANGDAEPWVHAICAATLDVMECVRRAFLDAGGALSEEHCPRGVEAVRAAGLPGVHVDGRGVVTLAPEFLDFITTGISAVRLVKGGALAG